MYLENPNQTKALMKVIGRITGRRNTEGRNIVKSKGVVMAIIL